MDAETYIDPDQAARLLSDLNQQSAGPRAPVDFEEAGKRYLLQALAESARQRWEQACPPDMRESDWAHPAMTPCASKIRAILEHQAGGPKGICAAGETGHGKTRALWALMRRFACDEGRKVSAFAAIDWFTTLQESLSFGKDNARGWVEAIARRPIVFIDDFGQEALQSSRESWAMSWFFRFLDIRVGERLPLYLTTNLTAKALASAQNRSSPSAIRGDPLLRRLSDLCEFIRFTPDSEQTFATPASNSPAAPIQFCQSQKTKAKNR